MEQYVVVAAVQGGLGGLRNAKRDEQGGEQSDSESIDSRGINPMKVADV